MASPLIDLRIVLEQFDKLQAEGELFYHATQPTFVEDGGLEFEFRIPHAFSSKPQLAANGEETKTAQSARRPPPSDGSDIDHSDPAFFVSHITPPHAPDRPQTHKLILNKFCVFRPQFILLTTDPKLRQTSPLDADDLSAALVVLDHLKTPNPHYVLFNGGREGGSSRSHKHMQVLECPRTETGARSLMWPGSDAVKPLGAELGQQSAGVQMLPLPYRVFFEAFDPDNDHVFQTVLAAYQLHLRACAEAFGLQSKEVDAALRDGRVPHNIILTREWLLTIPRRQATVDGMNGHVANATSMMGLVWPSNDAQAEGWKVKGPVNVLRALGVPSP